MNTKRILSMFILFTVLMLCCGAAFASDAIDDSNHNGSIIDDLELGGSGSGYDDSDSDDWDDDSDYEDDSDSDDWDDDSDYEDDFDSDAHPSLAKYPILVYGAVSSRMDVKYSSSYRMDAASKGSAYSGYNVSNAPRNMAKDSILVNDTVASSIVSVKESSRDNVDAVSNDSGEIVVKTVGYLSEGAKHVSAKTLPATGNPLAILGLALCSLVFYYRKR